MLLPTLLALTFAQSQDLTLSLGRINSGETSSGNFLAANYAHRLYKGLSGQIDFLASPNQKFSKANPLGSRDVASLYVMPGLRVSFKPEARLSPFVQGGAGLAVFEQSALLQNGAPFPGNRSTNHFGGMFGGGVDLKVYRFAGLRFEAKDYVSQRHNIALGVGLHFRWGAK
jgi:opacity protein-like surface antigen